MTTGRKILAVVTLRQRPGALTPIHINRTINRGLYVEPNLWVHHRIATERLRPPF